MLCLKQATESTFLVDITRSVQLPCFRTTAFSQVELFLDMTFPLKLLFLVMSASKSE